MSRHSKLENTPTSKLSSPMDGWNYGHQHLHRHRFLTNIWFGQHHSSTSLNQEMCMPTGYTLPLPSITHTHTHTPQLGATWTDHAPHPFMQILIARDKEIIDDKLKKATQLLPKSKERRQNMQMMTTVARTPDTYLQNGHNPQHIGG